MDPVVIASPTVAVVVSVLMQVFKRSALVPFMSVATPKINFLVSAVAAFLSAVLVSYNFNYDPATGDWAFAMAGNLGATMGAIGTAVVQWCEQHLVYKGFIVPAEILGEIRERLSKGQ